MICLFKQTLLNSCCLCPYACRSWLMHTAIDGWLKRLCSPPFPCHFLSLLTLIMYNIVIVISRLLNCHSKAKRRAPVGQQHLPLICPSLCHVIPSDSSLHLPPRRREADICAFSL